MNKEKLKKVIALSLAFVLSIGVFVAPGSQMAYAATKKVIKEGEIDLPQAKSVVGKFKVGGKRAFCLQHTKFAPPSGSSGTVTITNNKNVKRAMYYGWEGKEPWSGFKAIKKYGWSKTEHGIALTSLLLSTYFNGESASLYTYIEGFSEFKKYVESKPYIKDNRIYFSKSSLTAKWDSKLGLQKTDSVTMKGASGSKLSFTLPSGITLVHSDGRKDTGKVTVKVGDTFYLTAKANVTKPFKTGTIGTDWKFQAEVIAVKGNYQKIGYFVTPKDKGAETSLEVSWNLLGNAKIIKKSASGKSINGATFNIKSEDGSVNKTVTTDKSGEILVSGLKAGKYTVKETFVPAPYLLDKTAKTITVKPNEMAEVTFTNDLPTGKFELKKTREDGKALKGAKFRIWSEGVDLEGNKIEFDKSFTTDDKGLIVIENLKLGSYKYQEIEAPNGYLTDKKVRSFTLSYKNNETSVVTSTGNVSNKMPRGEFLLTKEGTDKSKLAGAQYKIWSEGKDYEGNEIGYEKVFTTDKNGEIHVKDLKLGKYKFKEVKAPSGYVLDESIGEFTLEYKDQNTAVIKVSASRTDKKVTVKKTDVADKNVVGAELKVTDKDGNVVDSWTVKEGEEEHVVENLVEGKTYTLYEDYAAESYVISKPVEFTVNKDKVDQCVKMIDIQVEFFKEDTNGKLIGGMEYVVTNNKTKDIVDKGVINSDKANYLNNLKAGETYTITETKAPDGYAKGVPVEFTVTEKAENQKVTMVNKKVSVKKTDFDGKNVAGAKLKITDKDENVVDSWTVKEGEEEHIVTGLNEGEKYVLTEEYAPDGFVISDEVEFEVSKEKKDQIITMIDKKVKFEKEGTLGTNLKGGEFLVKDKDGKVIQKLSAAKEGIYLNNLKEGETYEIEELKAPEGYEIADPVKFKVTSDKETQVVKMKDKKIPFISTPKTPDTPNTPKTGDPNGWIWIAILVLVGSGVTAARIVSRKKEIEKRKSEK